MPTITQDQAIEQAEKVRECVGNALAKIPGLDIDVEEAFRFTVNSYGAPTMMDAFWTDEPRPEGYGPGRRYYVIASVVTYTDAPRPLGDGYVEVTWVDEDLPDLDDNGLRTVLPMTFVSAADLGDGEPLARLAVDAVRADRRGADS